MITTSYLESIVNRVLGVSDVYVMEYLANGRPVPLTLLEQHGPVQLIDAKSERMEEDAAS
jgi:hypothetical protein